MKKFSWNRDLTLLAVAIVLFAALSVITPQNFLSKNNLIAMASQFPELCVLSLGMMCVILTGGIDLSLMSATALAGVVAAMVLREGKKAGLADENQFMLIVLGILTAIAVALVCGVINGIAVAKLGVYPILVTIGTQQVFLGVGNLIGKGNSVSGFPSGFLAIGKESFLGIPILMYIAAAVVIVSWILLNKTAWGRSVYMFGANAKATEYSGINTVSVNFRVYIFTSVIAGIAAVMMISRYNAGKPDLGSSYLLQSISVVVLGGTKIEGGHGTVAGTVIAAMIMQIVSSGMKMLGVNNYTVDVILGALLIVILLFNFVSANISMKRKLLKESAFQQVLSE